MSCVQHQGRVLVAVSIMAATAAEIGPSGRWMGVDLGTAGATVFMLSVGVAIGLLATRRSDVFAEDMSMIERRAWVGLAFVAVISANYAQGPLALHSHGVTPDSLHDMFGHRFIQQLIVLGIAWSVCSHLVGREGGIEEDERDLRLRRRADRAADWALTLIVIGGVGVLAWTPRESLPWWLAPIVLANVLIGLLITKSLVEHLVLAISYRRA